MRIIRRLAGSAFTTVSDREQAHLGGSVDQTLGVHGHSASTRQAQPGWRRLCAAIRVRTCDEDMEDYAAIEREASGLS